MLADAITGHEAADGYASILYTAKERRVAGSEEHFWSMKVRRALYPGRHTVLSGYDPTAPRPRQLRFGRGTSEDMVTGYPFEHYDYPGGIYDSEEAQQEAAVRAQAGRADHTIIEVEGNTMGLGLGNLVSLRPGPDGADGEPLWSEDDFGKQYLVVGASYHLSVDQYETGDVAFSDEPFKATYQLLDSHTQFRPARVTRKPHMPGRQTALVVGPANEEIWTDKHGRVMVQLDWDRLGERNEKASCWIRLAQPWSGAKFGAQYLPRVGQEVIVAFLDGDPDRPIITGSLFNKDNMPPYDLPANQTQSGIKSRSSKGGTASNFNELRFEDKKGQEELHLQAEKNMSTLVKHDQTLHVGANRGIVVGHDETNLVKNDRQLTVDVNDSVVIGGTHDKTVTGAVTQLYGGDHSRKVDGQQAFFAEKNKDEHVKLAHKLTTDKKFQLNQGATSMTFKGTNVTVDSAGTITLTAGGATVCLDKTGKATFDSPTGIKFVCGASSLAILPGGVAIASPAVTAAAGASSVVAMGEETAVMKSKTVTIEADGVCTIKGKSALKLQEADPVEARKNKGTSPGAGESPSAPGAVGKAPPPAGKHPGLDQPQGPADDFKPSTFAIKELVQVVQFNGSEKNVPVNGGRQYINLDDKTDLSKAHPEYGHFIRLKARVQCLEGSQSPAGQTVYFSNLPGAKNRAGLSAGDREGFGSAGGSATTSVTTDANGWTPEIKFYLSGYGGDEFAVAASLVAKSSASDPRTGTYVVWRRIFYDILEMKTKDGAGRYELSPAIQARVKAGFGDVFIDLFDTGKRALGDYHDNFDEVEKAFKWADGYCSADGVPLKLHICVVDRAIPFAGPYGAQKKNIEEDVDAAVYTSKRKISAYDFSGHAWLVKKEYLDGTIWKPVSAKITLDGSRGDRKYIVDFTGTPLSPSPTRKIRVRITYMQPGSYGGWGGANSLHLVLCRGTYEDMMSKSDADKQITVACIHEPGHAMGLVNIAATWHDARHSSHCKYRSCTMWFESSPGNERFHNEGTSDPGCRTFLRQKALDKNAMQTSWKFPR